MTEKRLRCRWQMWAPLREMRAYQCQYGAKTTRELEVGAPSLSRPAHREVLPVCGLHARQYDRNPSSWACSAYQWNGSRYESPVQEYLP